MVNLVSKSEIPYMYLFVRDDLTPAQQIIQVSHAVESLCQNYNHKGTSHAVLISVKDEAELVAVSEFLFYNNIQQSMFFEIDISSYTAIAAGPISGKKRNLLKRYKLKE